MDIIKYKKIKNGKYEIVTDKNTFELYEDIILKHNLLINKKIENLDQLLSDNREYDAYYQSLKYLRIRLRSVNEIKQYLDKKEFSKENITNTIEKLEKQGYLNDRIYAKSFLHEKLITTSYGPYKIKKLLEEKKISQKIIDDSLTEYTEEKQEEKAQKKMIKMVKANRNKGNNLLKKKIYNDLIIDGFSKKIVNKLVENLSLESDKKIYDKEYQKLYKNLSKKYSGKELEYRINKKMYQKGFTNQ